MSAPSDGQPYIILTDYADGGQSWLSYGPDQFAQADAAYGRKVERMLMAAGGANTLRQVQLFRVTGLACLGAISSEAPAAAEAPPADEPIELELTAYGKSLMPHGVHIVEDLDRGLIMVPNDPPTEWPLGTTAADEPLYPDV